MKPIDIRPFETAVNPSTRVAIVIPANYTTDLVAAGLALQMALKKVNQSVILLSSTPAKVGNSNLFDIDQLVSSLPSENFVITLKNAVPKLKRVKHFVDGEDLKFMLFPRENAEKFNPSDISNNYEAASFDFVIALGQDARSVALSFPELANTTTLIISHNPSHISNTETSQSISDPEAGSVSEIVARIIQSAKLPIWEDLAYNIFQGLSSATDNFSVARVTQGILEAAAWAVSNGAGRTALSVSQPARPMPQPREDYRSVTGKDQPQPARDHDRRNRNRSRHSRPSGFDNSTRQQPSNYPNSPTSINRSGQNQSGSVSDWESKPKIYQGSTVVEPESNK